MVKTTDVIDKPCKRITLKENNQELKETLELEKVAILFIFLHYTRPKWLCGLGWSRDSYRGNGSWSLLINKLILNVFILLSKKK